MATLVSPQIRYVANAMDNCRPSCVNSGIVPDQRHLDDGGYHCSVEDLIRYGNQKDYSNVRPTDKNQNIKYGAAIDTSCNTSDMVVIHNRVMAVYNDRTDPRRKYFNAVNCWDGSGDAVRIDFIANKISYATPDHKWHFHDETCRCYLLDWTMAYAKASVYNGETKAQWLAKNLRPDLEDDMLFLAMAGNEPYKPVYMCNMMYRWVVADNKDNYANLGNIAYLVNDAKMFEIWTNPKGLAEGMQIMGLWMWRACDDGFGLVRPAGPDGMDSSVVVLDPIQEDRMVDKLFAKLGGLVFMGQPKV